MATIEDLDHKPISEMSVDEAIEHLRIIRLSRRVQKSSKKSTSKKPTKGEKELTALQAKKLLDLIGG